MLETAVWCLLRTVFQTHPLYDLIDLLYIPDLILILAVFISPYNGQGGTRSSKNNGKENEFEYIFS